MKHFGWFGVLWTLGLVVVGGLIGFVWLPGSARTADQSLFAAWCSAFGLPKSWAASTATVVPGPSSEVVLSHELLAKPQQADIASGAALAQRCAGCHGPTGSVPGSPHLAGQYAAVVYKQLRDFKSGIRTNAIMTAMVAPLADIEMRQLAAYYASLHRPTGPLAVGSAPQIVKWGAPMRNIAPCGSCHGEVDHTMASPWLEGQPKDYLSAQLTAFESGKRRNDINGQMRAMAHGLSPQEIDQAASYYANGK